MTRCIMQKHFQDFVCLVIYMNFLIENFHTHILEKFNMINDLISRPKLGFLRTYIVMYLLKSIVSMNLN